MKIENITISNVNLDNNSAKLTFNIIECTKNVNVHLKINEDEYISIYTNKSNGTLNYNLTNLRRGVNNLFLKLITSDEEYITDVITVIIKENGSISDINCTYTDSNGKYILEFLLSGDTYLKYSIDINIDNTGYKQIYEAQIVGLKTYEGTGLSLGTHKCKIRINDGYDTYETSEYTFNVTNHKPLLSDLAIVDINNDGSCSICYGVNDVENSILTHSLMIDNNKRSITPTKTNDFYSYTVTGLSTGQHTLMVSVSDKQDENITQQEPEIVSSTIRPTLINGNSWQNTMNIYDNNIDTAATVSINSSNYSSRYLTTEFSDINIPENAQIESATLYVIAKQSSSTSNRRITVYADVNENQSNRVINQQLTSTSNTTLTADISNYIKDLTNLKITGYTSGSSYQSQTFSIYEIYIDVVYTFQTTETELPTEDVYTSSVTIEIFQNTTNNKRLLEIAKTRYDFSYQQLKRVIETTISDKIFNYNIENEVIIKSQNYYREMYSEFNRVSMMSIDIIGNKKIESAKTDLNNEISDISNAIDTLENTMETTFKDGILSDSEKDTLRSILNLVAKEKTDIDRDYTNLYNNEDLTGDAKTNLKSAYDTFVSRHNTLTTTVNDIINKTGIIDNTDKSNLDTAFTNWRTALGNYRDASMNAIDAIARKKVDDSADVVNEYWSEIILGEDGIQERVGSLETKVTGTGGIDERLRTAEQKITVDGITNLIKDRYYTKGEIDTQIDVTVVSVKNQYYLSTSATSLSGGSWSDMAPTWAEDKYMWSRTVTTLADGTTKTGEPICITGSSGEDGQTYYTWIRYADDSDGNGISNDPTNKAYIGFAYNKTSQTESDKASDYIWSKIKGEDGLNGKDGTSVTILGTYDSVDELNQAHPSGNKNGDGYIVNSDLYVWDGSKFLNVGQIKGDDGKDGKDGSTPYVHIKYSNDGGESFTPNSGEDSGDYMGIYTDYTVSDSTDVNSYTWSKIKGQDGIPGTDGKDGQTHYTWIKYSDNSDGTNLYDTPNSETKYIGIAYNKTTATESTNKSDYIWSKMKGEDGVPGNDGRGIVSVTPQYYLSTSKTSQSGGSWSETSPTWQSGKYLWIRYKIMYENPSSTGYTTPVLDDSWEGLVDLQGQVNENREEIETTKETVAEHTTALNSITSRVSTTESNVTKINGDITSVTERISSAEQKITEDAITNTVSKNFYTKTQADEKVNSIEIGGRNLLLNSETPSFLPNTTGRGATGDVIVSNGVSYRTITPSSGNAIYSYCVINNDLCAEYPQSSFANNEVVFSMDVRPAENCKVRVRIHSTYGEYFTCQKSVWTRIHVIAIPTSSWGGSVILEVDTVNVPLDVKKIKLELGNKATDWTPAPEDIDLKIENASSSFEQTVDGFEMRIKQNETDVSALKLKSNEFDVSIKNKADSSNIISKINASTEGITISSSKIGISGFVTFSDLSSSGYSTINGSNITSGTIRGIKIISSTSDSESRGELAGSGLNFYSPSKLAGTIFFDSNGEGTEESAKDRFLIQSRNNYVLKLLSAGDMSLQATDEIFFQANKIRTVNPFYADMIYSAGISNSEDITTKTLSASISASIKTLDVTSGSVLSGTTTCAYLTCNNSVTMHSSLSCGSSISAGDDISAHGGNAKLSYDYLYAPVGSANRYNLRLGIFLLQADNSYGYLFTSTSGDWMPIMASEVYSNRVLLSSDERLKTDIKYVNKDEQTVNPIGLASPNVNITTSDMHEFIETLPMVSYRLVDELNRNIDDTHYGFLAQEILYTKVGSELIEVQKDGYGNEVEGGYLRYSQDKYTSFICGALQEEIKRRKELEEKVLMLEQKINKED